MRRSLTQKESQDMLAEQQGRCACKCGCRNEITLNTCIREHTWAVALGNDEKPDRLLCNYCAPRKTFGTKATTKGSDLHSIARAKRLAAGGKKRKGPKIPSRGWPKKEMAK